MSREWNGSSVMGEFIKIAAESGLITTNLKPENKDFVGNPSKETPVKDHRRYEPTEEYGVTKDEDIIEIAHPKKVQVADAMGEGGVVENQNEQQEKDIYIATKMPNGALVGVHATLINELIKLATQLDEQGKYKEAVRIDKTIKRLSSLPFEYSHLTKKAWVWPAVSLIGLFAPRVINWFRTTKGRAGGPRIPKPGAKPISGKSRIPYTIMSGIGIIGMLGKRVTSLNEGILTDSQDLIDVLSKSDKPTAQSAFRILLPLVNDLKATDLTTGKGMETFSKTIEKMSAALPVLERYIYVYSQIEDPSVTGFGLSARVSEKFEDFKSGLKDAAKTIAQLSNVGAKADAAAQQDLGKSESAPPVGLESNKGTYLLQQILFLRGFPKGEVWNGKVTGKMDETTILAAQGLERKLDKSLQEFNQKEGLSGTFQGQVVKDGQMVIDIHKLLEILNLTERYLTTKSK